MKCEKSHVFQDYDRYDGQDLGATIAEGETRFALWSPAASKVTLRLYPDGGAGASGGRTVMEKDSCGVFRATLAGNRHGTYYDFEIVTDSRVTATADPYAKACGVNGVRSMVVDLGLTDPEGWERDQAPPGSVEDIIYELHVKEFSWDRAGGFPEAVRGTYRAFLETDTSLVGRGEFPTGIPYLKALGVTHIQLMPVYDFGSVDEAGGREQFNWGYDPVNYFVPEGSYSTDACRGEVRIRELKELVMSLHRQGFRVIMDVVFNHTYSADSWLERTVPGYYYRREEDGRLSDGSGCGNDIASERPMCSRYIRDCVKYWAEEYHMDGFRFDLMGLLDVELMNDIRKDLDTRFGRGQKLIYGEPWSLRPTPMERGSIPALKENVGLLDPEVGIFCDNTRDTVKGHVFEASASGFMSGGPGFEEDMLESVTAWCGSRRVPGLKAPSQVITYISAHDNWTLWDKLVLCMGDGESFYRADPSILSANRLAAALCFSCQGRLFLLSGEEFGRTKGGHDDSYCAPADVNALDWKRAFEYRELVEYYRGLIGLRKQLPGLCDKTSGAAKRLLAKKVEGEGFISCHLDNRAGSGISIYDQIWMACNVGESKGETTLPPGNWTLLADENRSDLWKKPNGIFQGTMGLEPGTYRLWGRRPQ